MDERQLQLKEMKKNYKQLRAKAGWGWRLPSWLLFVLWLPVTGITMFVLFNHVPFVQLIDSRLWESVKAVLNLRIDYAYFWRLAERYGLIVSVFSGVLWLLFAVLAGWKRSTVRKSDEYLTYRTLKLTLETEKAEK